MPLQSDPTIVYGLVGGKGTLGRGILKSELEQKTPYNTYANAGLPPGPIANPGKAALEAVANPSRTKELYFVADGTGGHAFSDNLDQHRANVQRWRQIEKEAKDKADPDGAKAVAPAAQPSGAVQKLDQRGDLLDAGTVYGSLLGGFKAPARSASDPVPTSGVTSFPVSSFTANAPVLNGGSSANATSRPGSDSDELDIEVAGVKTKPGPDDQPDQDGDVPAGQVGSMETFPVSAARLADERSRARAYGLQPAANAPAPTAALDASTGNQPLRTNLKFGKEQIFDASEGTALDPLRNKSYDLNSAKTVPVLKPLPAAAAYAN
jgi:UPF0755 protein